MNKDVIKLLQILIKTFNKWVWELDYSNTNNGKQYFLEARYCTSEPKGISRDMIEKIIKENNLRLRINDFTLWEIDHYNDKCKMILNVAPSNKSFSELIDRVNSIK